MHLHLDVVGGVAGDMFAATMLDAWPDLETELIATIDRAGLGRLVTVGRHDFDDGVLVGSQVSVDPATKEAHHHRSWRDIREMLGTADLGDGVRRRALAIFQLLAEAESEVHGKPIEDVAFHEVGAWDSIADVVMAAWLIDHFDAASWSCSSIPAGSGMVNTVHGRLPVPTPATAHLIRGMPVFTDDIKGDRVTPTGAAILRHLSPDFSPRLSGYAYGKTGIGFGTSRFEGISNMLRVSVFDADHDHVDASQLQTESITQIQFEVDDQSPEDLALALERLRLFDGVLDVVQTPAFGKKGRMLSQIQVLATPAKKDAIVAQCFRQTSTLGLRLQNIERQILNRSEGAHNDQSGDSAAVRYKSARRPDGTVTVKAEMDDIGRSDLSYGERQALRQQVEVSALDNLSDRESGN